jgi:hypothetical protein
MVEDLGYFDQKPSVKCNHQIWFRTHCNESSLVLWWAVITVTRLGIPFRCARCLSRPGFTRLDRSSRDHQKNGTESEERAHLNVHHHVRGRLSLMSNSRRATDRSLFTPLKVSYHRSSISRLTCGDFVYRDTL